MPYQLSSRDKVRRSWTGSLCVPKFTSACCSAASPAGSLDHAALTHSGCERPLLLRCTALTCYTWSLGRAAAGRVLAVKTVSAESIDDIDGLSFANLCSIFGCGKFDRFLREFFTDLAPNGCTVNRATTDLYREVETWRGAEIAVMDIGGDRDTMGAARR